MDIEASLRPATSLKLLCDVALEIGVDPSSCLENTGIDINELNQPTAQSSIKQEIQAIENFVRLAVKVNH